jgi:hypothetical protein
VVRRKGTGVRGGREGEGIDAEDKGWEFRPDIMEIGESTRNVSMMGLRSWGMDRRRSVKRVADTSYGAVGMSSAKTRYHAPMSGSLGFIVGNNLSVIRYQRFRHSSATLPFRPSTLLGQTGYTPSTFPTHGSMYSTITHASSHSPGAVLEEGTVSNAAGVS